MHFILKLQKSLYPAFKRGNLFLLNTPSPSVTYECSTARNCFIVDFCSSVRPKEHMKTDETGVSEKIKINNC